VIARKAFDAALGQELHEVIREAKKMASQIQQVSDLWDLEHYLTQQPKEIDRKNDDRSSQLTHVFGRLCKTDHSVRKSCAASGNPGRNS
jgi:Photoprotection regulator fluorescence recovery protein